MSPSLTMNWPWHRLGSIALSVPWEFVSWGHSPIKHYQYGCSSPGTITRQLGQPASLQQGPGHLASSLSPLRLHHRPSTWHHSISRLSVFTVCTRKRGHEEIHCQPSGSRHHHHASTGFPLWSRRIRPRGLPWTIGAITSQRRTVTPSHSSPLPSSCWNEAMSSQS